MRNRIIDDDEAVGCSSPLVLFNISLRTAPHSFQAKVFLGLEKRKGLVLQRAVHVDNQSVPSACDGQRTVSPLHSTTPSRCRKADSSRIHASKVRLTDSTGVVHRGYTVHTHRRRPSQFTYKKRNFTSSNEFVMFPRTGHACKTTPTGLSGGGGERPQTAKALPAVPGGLGAMAIDERVAEPFTVRAWGARLEASDLMQRQSYQVKTVLENKGARKKTFPAFKDNLGNPLSRSHIEREVV